MAPLRAAAVWAALTGTTVILASAHDIPVWRPATLPTATATAVDGAADAWSDLRVSHRPTDAPALPRNLRGRGGGGGGGGALLGRDEDDADELKLGTATCGFYSDVCESASLRLLFRRASLAMMALMLVVCLCISRIILLAMPLCRDIVSSSPRPCDFWRRLSRYKPSLYTLFSPSMTTRKKIPGLTD